MTEAARIAEMIMRKVPALKAGSLRFWGQSFGRPLDNVHTVTGATADGESLEVRFDNGETLLVVRPAGWVVQDDTFRIDSATRLRWEWNAYGNPAGRRYFKEYVRDDVGRIEASTDVDWYVSSLRPSATEPAVLSCDALQHSVAGG